MPVRTYSSEHTSGEWWGSTIPRDAEGDIVVIQEIHHDYAACLSKKIREEWPYYTQLVRQIKCLHLYACADASIDDCHRSQTSGGGVCLCWGWKQLWHLQVFEKYNVGGPIESPSFVKDCSISHVQRRVVKVRFNTYQGSLE